MSKKFTLFLFLGIVDEVEEDMVVEDILEVVLN